MYITETNTAFVGPDYTDKLLYAKRDGVGRKPLGQEVLNSWQAWDLAEEESDFLHPEEFTFRAGDFLVFTWWYIKLKNGDTYRRALVYSLDKTLSPDGNPVHLVLKNPDEKDFSEWSTAREYDGMYNQIIETLNNVNQLFANLATACDQVVEIVNRFTPMSGVDYLQMYNGVNAKRTQILQVIDVELLRRLFYMVINYFSVHDTMFDNHPGVTNVIRNYPSGTEKIGAALVMYYSWLGVVLPLNEDGTKSSGRREVNYLGPVQSFKYTDPISLYNLDWWMKSLSDELDKTEQILSELSIIAPDVDNLVTEVEYPDNYLHPGDPYYKDPLTDIELEEKKYGAEEKKYDVEEKAELTTGKKVTAAVSIFYILRLLFG